MEAAIDVSQVYTTVADTQWRTHQARLAAIPEAGDAYELVVETWAGFEKYNSAVRQRTFISNDDLRSIAKVAERTVGALRVAGEAVVARHLF